MASSSTTSLSADPDDTSDDTNLPASEPDLESELIKTVLKLEEIDRNLYRGTHLWKPTGGRAVFGGQVVGQALVAAGHTKPDHVHVHSLHCYFIRPGNPDRPILYHVERTRDGRSFATRSVEAVQNGVPIFTMMVSYHKHEDSEMEHQYTMPDAIPPEELQSSDDLLRVFLKEGRIPDKHVPYVNKILANELPIEVKPVDPNSYFRYEVGEPKLLTWVRARGHIGESTQNIHRCVAAYISDWTLLRSSLVPFPTFQPRMMASLDHAMWFHSNFRADEWMLYECESPRSVGNRAMTLGRFWRRDGVLAVSTAQEGVIRGRMSSKM